MRGDTAMAGPIEIENLTIGYDRHPAIHHVSLMIGRGSLTAVVGPNGAGKSTLLKGLVGRLRPMEGRIRFRGVGDDGIAYLPQQADIDRQFPLSVIDFVAMGLWRRIGLFGAVTRADRARVADALAAVGLSGFERRGIATLSGGQVQRMLFARTLLQDAGLILLDEPLTAIDTKTAADLLDLIRRWHGEQRTVVTVLHDLDQVRGHFPETVLLAREVIAHGATADVLTARNLLRARQMCEAFDDRAEVCDRSSDRPAA